jgi:citrate synthase
VKIGRPRDRTTGISRADAHSIAVRERDLAQLIGTMTFTDYFVLLLMGRPPSDDERFFLDACLIAIAEHGLTPNVQAARMTLAADPDVLQAAVAAGILGCGSVVLGTAEKAGRMLDAAITRAREEGRDEIATARVIAGEYRSRREPLPGFGHPLHKPDDPRAQRLLALADERGTAGPHVRMIRAFGAVVEEVWGKPLTLNVSAAIPAVMLDVHFPLEALKGIPILARTAGLLAHLREDGTQPLGFYLADHAAEAVSYAAAMPGESEAR